jgi:SAM-dependent methyltransferase
MQTLRQFVWGDCDPYASFPCTPSHPPRKGWYSDHPLFEELVRQRRPRRVVEVGSLFGGSAIHIGQLLRQHDIDAEITCVDTFLGSRESFFEYRKARAKMLAAGHYHFFDEFLGNIQQAGLSQMVNPFVQTSTNAARILAEHGAKFDLIYLDASHEYGDVLSDLQLWYPLLDAGGILVGDDFEEPWFGVIRAAMEFADKIGRPLKLAKAFASSPTGGRENTKFMISAD